MISLSPSRVIGFSLIFGYCLGWGFATAKPLPPRVIFQPRYPDMEMTSRALEARQLNTSRETPPISVLVNHHLLAADLIAESLNKVPAKNIRHVILLAPNHFLNGRGRAQTINIDMMTPYGPIPVNHALVNHLRGDGLVSVESQSFVGEHGVANILPYIKRLLPRADVTPIILWEGMSQEKLEAVRQRINSFRQPGTLIIGSFDFSHYVTDTIAQEQDTVTLAALKKFELDHLRKRAVDSPEGLWLFMALTQDAGASRFRLDHATNSALMTKAPPKTEVTSYITGRFIR